MKLSCQRIVAGSCAIILMTLAAYSPALRAGFVWDDDYHLTENPNVASPDGLKTIWTSSSAMYYPLVLTTFWIQQRCWGLTPFPYHLFNILMHAANALLLWAILRKMKIPGAWLASTLFALHPVHVESVAWITELKNTQSGFFYLGSLLSFLQFHSALSGSRAEAPSQSRPWLWYSLALMLFALAILSKPSTVMLPVIFLLCVWWIDRHWEWRYLRWAAPFAFLSLLASVWTIWEQSFHSGAHGSEWSMPAAEKVIVASRIVWFYLGKLLFPYPLMFIYPRWQIDPRAFTSYLPLLALLASVAMLWRWRAGWSRAWLAAFAYFVILLFPVLGFFNIYFMRYSFVADHFQYLPSIAPLALFAGGMVTFLHRLGYWQKYLTPVLCGTLLVLMGILTWGQAHIYENDETLWRDALEQNPTAWIAHNNLGELVAMDGDIKEASAHFSEALRLKPDYAEAHNNLGVQLAAQGLFDLALTHFAETVRLKPDFPEAHNNLGHALASLGKLDEAVAQYRVALKIRPDYEKASYNLELALAAQRKTEATIQNRQQLDQTGQTTHSTSQP